MLNYAWVVMVLISMGSLWGCVSCDDESKASIKVKAVKHYTAMVEAGYADSLVLAVALRDAVNAFVASPSESGLVAARKAWLAAREPYLQTEVFRFYGGPIDDEKNGLEGLLNAWPLDESYLDYTVDAADAGLINRTDFVISVDSIQAYNEKNGEKNIATGYHAIEFLLWGQDLSDTGPGSRPYTDYVVGGAGNNQHRRGEYLKAAAELLVQNLTTLHEQWNPSAPYRGAFESGDSDTSIKKILTGMMILSGFETGGERLQAALDSGDREDEHSCFSDNTHRDMIQDIQGIVNVLKGDYTRIDGKKMLGVGMDDVIGAVDAGLRNRLELQLSAALEQARALKVPFEGEIVPTNKEGRARVQALIGSLRAVEDTLEVVFEKMGFTAPIPG